MISLHHLVNRTRQIKVPQILQGIRRYILRVDPCHDHFRIYSCRIKEISRIFLFGRWKYNSNLHPADSKASIGYALRKVTSGLLKKSLKKETKKRPTSWNHHTPSSKTTNSLTRPKPSPPKKNISDSIFLVSPQGAWPTELEKFLAKHQRTFPEHLASHLKKSGWIKHLATGMHSWNHQLKSLTRILPGKKPGWICSVIVAAF